MPRAHGPAAIIRIIVADVIRNERIILIFQRENIGVSPVSAFA
jgi:hypothetical protein